MIKYILVILFTLNFITAAQSATKENCKKLEEDKKYPEYRKCLIAKLKKIPGKLDLNTESSLLDWIKKKK